MTKEQLNILATETIANLTDHNYFQELKNIEGELRGYIDPMDKRFYLSQQDKVNNIYGELVAEYYKLLSEFKRYVVIRKTEIRIEHEGNGVKIPGNEALEDTAKSEINNLYAGTILMEGWVARAENTLKTCRSHQYDKTNSVIETENNYKNE